MRKSESEKIYTSTTDKLLVGGLKQLLTFQEKGLFSPQSLQIAPTDACQLDCKFCSVKLRNKGKTKPDSLDFEQLKKTIFNLFVLGGLKSVEITGGGDPTLYPQLEELISFCKGFGLKIGMICNGLGLKRIPIETLNQLTWLRISLSSLDAENVPNGKVIIPEIPQIKGDLGFSFVWSIDTNLAELDRMIKIALDNQAKYVRIVPDCRDTSTQAILRDKILPIMKEYNKRIGKELLFFQAKSYDVVAPCRVGYLKPFLNADGYFYHCSACPLYNLKFSPEWRMGHMSEINKIWTKENITKGFDCKPCKTGKCFQGEQNALINNLVKEIPHRSFL